MIGAMAAMAAMAAGCGAGEDADAPTEVAEESAQRVITLGASDYFPNVGGDVRALAFLPHPTPWRGRVLAAFATEGGGALALINVAAGDVALAPFARAEALVTAPAFELRGSPAPLVLAAGGALEQVTVSLYIEQAPDLAALVDAEPGAPEQPGVSTARLAPVPTEPIAPDLDIERICPLRATNALVEFIVVDPAYAEVWRLRDVGGDALGAEKVRDAPEAAGAAACAPRSGGRAVTLDANGQLNDGPSLAALAVTPLNDGFGGEAVLGARATPSGDLIALDPDSADVLALARIEAQLNTAAVGAADVLAASTANFGGSYNQGALVVAEGPALSVIALDTVVDALAAAP